MDNLKKEEVFSFFENLYKLFKSKRTNNRFDKKTQNDVNFLCTIYGNLDMKYNMYAGCANISINSNNLNNNNNWTMGTFYSDFQSLSTFFSYPATYEIFKIIKKLFLEEHYKLEESIVISKINYEQFNFPNTTSDINNRFIQDVYLYSINKLFISIYSFWNQNYDKFIRNQNEYYKLMNNYDMIMSKYNLQHLRPYISNSGSGNEFSDTNNGNLLFGGWDNTNYQPFNEIWTLLNSHLTILSDGQKLLNNINKPKVEEPKAEKPKVEKPKAEKPKEEPKEEKPKAEKPKEEPKEEEPKAEKPKEDKKSKREKIPSTVRNSLWKDYFDQSTQGICQCCQRENITLANFEAGHIISVKDGGENHLSNLKPICSQCNKSMGSTNMNDFIKKHGFDVPPNKIINEKDDIDTYLLSMKHDELKIICKNIGIKVSYNNKKDCVNSIITFFDNKNTDDIISMCKDKLLPSSGNKLKLCINIINNSKKVKELVI